jgi:hypothetical protein
MPRLSFCVLLLSLAACQAVAPEPEPESTVSWSGISDHSPQCPSISFELVQKDRMLEGWASGAGGERLLSEVRGTIEGTEVRLAMDRNLWTGNRSGDSITLQEPAGCRRTVVPTQSP